MPHRLSRRHAVTALASFAAGACTPSRVPTNGESLHRALREIRTAHALPGLAAAVIRGSSVVAVGVDGVRRAGSTEEIEPADRFHIASCTKSMTATLAAIAVRRGLLDWSARLADCLPDLAAAARPEYRGATLDQLLAHAAQMPPFTQPGPERVAWMHGLQGTPAEQRLTFLSDVLAHEPPNLGTGDAAYSNVGYVAACAMLERRTNIGWEESVRRELAEPMGWTSMGFGYPASPSSPHQPRGHALVDGRMEILPFDPARTLATCLNPAGAIHLSIVDFARYASDRLNGLRGRPALLPAEFYIRLHTQLAGANSIFTLGWGVRRDEQLGRLHFGAGSGGWFFARIWIAPERDMAVVTMSNSGDAANATRELTLRLFNAYAG